MQGDAGSPDTGGEGQALIPQGSAHLIGRLTGSSPAADCNIEGIHAAFAAGLPFAAVALLAVAVRRIALRTSAAERLGRAVPRAARNGGAAGAFIQAAQRHPRRNEDRAVLL
jgi:hypothetical protein